MQGLVPTPGLTRGNLDNLGLPPGGREGGGNFCVLSTPLRAQVCTPKTHIQVCPHPPSKAIPPAPRRTLTQEASSWFLPCMGHPHNAPPPQPISVLLVHLQNHPYNAPPPQPISVLLVHLPNHPYNAPPPPSPQPISFLFVHLQSHACVAPEGISVGQKTEMDWARSGK